MKGWPTPGPWTVELDVTSDGDIDVFAAHLLSVAIASCRDDLDDFGAPPRESAIANAYIIAAAPDLLEACRRVVTLTAAHPLLAAEMDIPLVKAAIAKAEGK